MFFDAFPMIFKCSNQYVDKTSKDKTSKDKMYYDKRSQDKKFKWDKTSKGQKA